MSEERNHRLFQIFTIFNVFVMLVLLVLEPVFLVLWLLLLVLGCIVFSLVKPAVWQPEMNRLRRKWAAFKKRFFSAPGNDDARKITFVPDHELVSTQAGRQERYLVDCESYLIGRSSKCNCVLKSSPTVGKEHCRIIFRKYSQEYYVEDLRSQNGTYLGTRRLEPFTQEMLLENSELTIGDCCFRFVKKTGSAAS